MSIEFINESGDATLNEEMLIDVARFTLQAMDVSLEAECTLTAVDLAAMAELHVRWMDLEGPTDVMSFPMDEVTPGSASRRPDAPDLGPEMLGDIVLCPEFAQQQADAAGHSLGHELALLTVHGCLHLLGYDHGTPAEEKEMFSLQNELLADWYDDVAQRGLSFHPKPAGPQAFPDAAMRAALDKEVPGGGIPAIGEAPADSAQL